MNVIDQLSQDLALRTPQRAALLTLSRVLDSVPNLRAPLQTVAGDIAGIGRFERFDTAFPSFCFNIATAVGKTRLMGACIAYLYQTKGWRNFFILTKGTTVYRKTIDNFTLGHPKYVLQEYAGLPGATALITGDTYERQEVASRLTPAQMSFLGNYLNIFVFNVEKLFGDKDANRRFHETPNEILGDSMANLLRAQPDLVLLMDESHTYRAEESMRVINGLRPLLGLEFTATPKSPNIIYRYSLGQAITTSVAHLADPSKPSGYIKVPVVLGRRDLHTHDADYEAMQLQDGIARHRRKKVSLEAFCQNQSIPTIVPIVLISTKDIKHAEAVRQRIEADDFFAGEYKGKVVVTHSKTGDLREDDITGLLALEEPVDGRDPATVKEVVIHVNKLREGWDVRNVYTIIPLRASKSDILTEQTIGRGLRLPFGVQTGDEDLDTLEIAAHDHFAAIVSEAHANSARTGTPIITKEITHRERAETEKRTVMPLVGSPHEITVPIIAPVVRSAARLEDFPIVPRYSFDSVAPTLVGTVLGTNQQRVFDVPPFEMTDDPLIYLVRLVFEKCNQISADDTNDRALVPSLVRRYLTTVESDTTAWKGYVQAHGREMISDLVAQIKEHVVASTVVTWTSAAGSMLWKPWHRAVPKNYTPPDRASVADADYKGKVIGGYTKTIYVENEFDSKQEKILADILVRDEAVSSWVRVPDGQIPIFYAAGNYNPDFLADDGSVISLIEIKAASETGDQTVRRKASAALAWCRAASQASGRTWVYRLIPHDALELSDSFAGVMSKAVVLEDATVEEATAEDTPSGATQEPAAEE